MPITRIPFGQLAWEQSATHPLEQKKVAGDRAAALLRLAPGFADPHECERSHVLYVLAGELELAGADGVIRVRSGEACWIDRGSGHRARNPGSEPVLVFIISDI